MLCLSGERSDYADEGCPAPLKYLQFLRDLIVKFNLKKCRVLQLTRCAS